MPTPTDVVDKNVKEPRKSKKETPPDTYITLSGIDWATFEGIADRTRGGRIRYNNGELEILSPSIHHEDYGDRLREFVVTFCETLDIEMEAVGSTTWKAPGPKKGIEADATYYLDPNKLPTIADLKSRGEKRITRYPAPDLVIEIDSAGPSASGPRSMRRSARSRSGSSTARLCGWVAWARTVRTKISSVPAGSPSLIMRSRLCWRMRPEEPWRDGGRCGPSSRGFSSGKVASSTAAGN